MLAAKKNAPSSSCLPSAWPTLASITTCCGSSAAGCWAGTLPSACWPHAGRGARERIAQGTWAAVHRQHARAWDSSRPRRRSRSRPGEPHPRPCGCRRSAPPARSSRERSLPAHSAIRSAESAKDRREAADFDMPAPAPVGTSPSGKRTARPKRRVETPISIRFIAHRPNQSSRTRGAQHSPCCRGSRSARRSGPTGAHDARHPGHAVHRQSKPEQTNDGADQALGLARRQAEHRARCERRQNSER